RKRVHLTKLKIENLALVDSLDIDFLSGGISVTGETGAGKSMILGALRLLVGGRADATMLRKGKDRAIIEGVYEADSKDDAREQEWKKRLTEAGFELDKNDPVIIRRELTRTGRSIAQIAGRLVTVKQLAELTENLIDIHSQRDQQSLSRKSQQREAVDSFAGTGKLVREVADNYHKWKSAKADYDEWLSRERELRREEDLFQFQLNEIRGANIQIDEDKELSQRENILANAGEIRSTIAKILSLLQNDDSGVLNQLSGLRREFQKIIKLDNKTGEWEELLAQSLVTLSEFEQQLSSYQEGIYVNPAELINVQDRLDTLSKLKRKYGDTLEEVINFANEVEDKLNTLGNFDEHVSGLKIKVEQAKKHLDMSAEKLTKKRIKAAEKLSKIVKSELSDLGMKETNFFVKIETRDEITETGAEDIEFYIAVNPGEDAKPISKVASGGELSRITLAIKCVTTCNNDVPILIFDEIDSGIGGTVAHAVAERLLRLADEHQIFVITHMPQIACRSKSHFVVTKKTSGNKTSVRIDYLQPEKRDKEIARMLGGESETTLAHAKELLKN
ncbi:MAG: DNA repair protein RecN, partial [Victivallaceae bacterium]|nr:DNA repair protein RecN [Victivallaceae bacterium]